MRFTIALIVPLLTVGVGGALFVSANHCAGGGEAGALQHTCDACPSGNDPYAVGPFYVTVDEVVSNDYLFSIWVYQESNGAEGLQRHDDYCYTYGYNSDELADTVIF